jgi:hypothetical protein
MNDSILRDTLQRIQDLIAKSTGKPLQGQAEKRLENVLRNMLDHPENGAANGSFLNREVTKVHGRFHHGAVWRHDSTRG